MRRTPLKRLFTLIVFVASTSSVFGQNFPRAEVFGGYAFDRQGQLNIKKGWNAAFAWNLNRWFGVVADVSGHYYPGLVFDIPPVFNPGVFCCLIPVTNHLTMFRFGPQFALRTRIATPFAHALFGGAYSKWTGSARAGTTPLSVSEGFSGFATALGGGVDLGSGKVAVRAVQVDYSYFQINTFGMGELANGVRISSGIVVRF